MFLCRCRLVIILLLPLQKSNNLIIQSKYYETSSIPCIVFLFVGMFCSHLKYWQSVLPGGAAPTWDCDLTGTVVNDPINVFM